MSCRAPFKGSCSSNSQSALGCPGLRSFELLRFLGPLAPQKVVYKVSEHATSRYSLVGPRGSRVYVGSTLFNDCACLFQQLRVFWIQLMLVLPKLRSECYQAVVFALETILPRFVILKHLFEGFVSGRCTTPFLHDTVFQ